MIDDEKYGKESNYHLREKAFTATAEDFNNQTLFMNIAYEDDDTADLYKQSAKMKYGEDIGLKEAASTIFIDKAVMKPLGVISGIDNAVDDNVELVKREWNKSGPEHFGDLVNVSNVVVDASKEAISNPKQTLDNAIDGAKQLKEEAITEWNYRKLKNQQGLPFETSYKDAQMLGGIATDGVMGGGAGKLVKVGKEGLENIGGNIDNLTPPPAYATVSGTPNIYGDATATTGKPNTNGGIRGAETGGAILAVSDAEGKYTHNPDGSVIGSGGGRATSTGKFDENGEEIYQRDSGGYYIVDKNGVQRPAQSPNERPEANNTGYNRSYLRKQTNEAIEANYTKLPNGDYYNPVADVTIKGPIDIGHAYGWEHRRLELAAEEVGLTQPQFNEYVNRHPEHFQLENMSINRSHVDEKPGKDEIEDITKEMLKDLNNGDLNR